MEKKENVLFYACQHVAQAQTSEKIAAVAHVVRVATESSLLADAATQSASFVLHACATALAWPVAVTYAQWFLHTTAWYESALRHALCGALCENEITFFKKVVRTMALYAARNRAHSGKIARELFEAIANASRMKAKGLAEGATWCKTYLEHDHHDLVLQITLYMQSRTERQLFNFLEKVV
jgi:hypothetical protein